VKCGCFCARVFVRNGRSSIGRIHWFDFLCFVLVTIADFVSAIVYLRACSARARGKSFGFR